MASGYLDERGEGENQNLVSIVQQLSRATGLPTAGAQGSTDADADAEPRGQSLTAVMERLVKVATSAVGACGRDRERYHLELYLAGVDLQGLAEVLRRLARELVTHTSDVVEAMDSRHLKNGGGS